jgi:hypothetical protein
MFYQRPVGSEDGALQPTEQGAQLHRRSRRFMFRPEPLTQVSTYEKGSFGGMRTKAFLHSPVTQQTVSYRGNLPITQQPFINKAQPFTKKGKYR